MDVLITGASKGIGYALAKKFSRQENCILYLVSRSADNLAKLKAECQAVNKGTDVHTIPFDLTTLQSEDLPAELQGKHFDFVINNAGLLINKPFESYETDDIVGMLSTNFVAPVLLIQKLMPHLGGDSPTHIVNIGSMGGYQGSVKFPGLSIYSASKAALACVTECLALEMKERNVFINCLALGAVRTEMLNKAFPGFNAPLSADEMAGYIADFTIDGYNYFNGKVLPVSVSTP